MSVQHVLPQPNFHVRKNKKEKVLRGAGYLLFHLTVEWSDEDEARSDECVVAGRGVRVACACACVRVREGLRGGCIFFLSLSLNSFLCGFQIKKYVMTHSPFWFCF